MLSLQKNEPARDVRFHQRRCASGSQRPSFTRHDTQRDIRPAIEPKPLGQRRGAVGYRERTDRRDPQGAALLARLDEHAISEDFTYRHEWRAGDVVIWDNRPTMHKATPYDDQAYIRIMHRATIKGVDRPA